MATPINYDNQPAVLVLARDITDRKRAEAALRESEAQARAHAAHVELQHYLMEQRERERLQIARDLHDGPMQRLAAINYELESVLRDSRVEEIRAELREVETALSREIADLRAYSNLLRPPVLTRFGLEAGIRAFAGTFQETHPDLTLHLDIGPETSRLSQRVRLALFRIFQEALYNVTEHSQASEITVRLHFVGKAVKLEVRDNGAGFALIPGELELARQGKLGLAGMREHAEAVGGTFHVQSWPGEGTIVRVTAPLEEEEAAPSGGKRRGRADT
jgi:signal transduction histidine kinase